jgi:hypothetical protein
MRRLTLGIRSEKCVVRRFRRCANVIEYTYIDLESTAYYIPSIYIYIYIYICIYILLLLGYKPVQRVTVLNTVDKYYNIVL